MVSRIVELKSVLNKAKFVDLKVCEKISDFLKENFVEDLTYLEKKNKMKIDIITDNTLIIPLCASRYLSSVVAVL